MGVRLKKSVKMGKHAKINFNKDSVGFTVGTKGLHYTINSKGRTTATVGIPGTGLSYSNKSKSGTQFNDTNNIQSQSKKEINPVINFIITFLFGWLGIHKFINGKIGIGILYIFTVGLFGIGWIIDTVKSLMAIFDKPVAKSSNEYISTDITISPQNGLFPKDYHYVYNLADGKTLTQSGNNVTLEKGEKELFEGDIYDISPSGEFWLVVGLKNDDEAVSLFRKETPLQIKSFDFEFGKVFDTGIAICCCDDNILIITPDSVSKKTVAFGTSQKQSILCSDYCIFYEFDGYEMFIKTFNLISGTSWQKKKVFNEDIEGDIVAVRNGNFINVSIGTSFICTYDLNGNIQK